jgi:HK97 family phage prohead protease
MNGRKSAPEKLLTSLQMEGLMDSQPQLESRDLGLFAKIDNTELRIAAPETPNRLVGYAAVFNSLSADLGGFKERIVPGAFRGATGNDVRALVDHDASKLLGRTGNGTLRLSEDQVGLRVEIDLPDGVSYADDIKALVKRGDIRGMSFGFRVPTGGQRFVKEGGQTIRELTTVNLKEVTVTSIPAYGDTSVFVRSAKIDPGVLQEISRPNYARCASLFRRSLVKG